MSQRTVQGTISRTDSKNFPSKRGGPDVTLYSFQLEGNNQWFRTNETPLRASRGDQVEFVADGQKVDVSTIRVRPAVVQASPSVTAAASVTATTPTASARGSSGQAASRDEYWANKEARDLVKEERYQTVSEPRMALSVAVEAASRVVASALQHDALGFGNAAKSKRQALLSNFVKEVALDLAIFIQDAPTVLSDYRASVGNIVEVIEDNSNSGE